MTIWSTAFTKKTSQEEKTYNNLLMKHKSYTKKLSLPIIASKKIRDVLESPTQISYSTKLTQNIVANSLESSYNSRSPKSFLPFLTERDSHGKILPSDSLTPKMISKELSSPKLSHIQELETPKKYTKRYRLASPRLIQLPGVGSYTLISDFDKKQPGFYSPKSPKYPGMIQASSSDAAIDLDLAYQFKEKHNLYPNLKKTTGRGKKFFAPKHFNLSDAYNSKLPDKIYMVHPTLAEIDVNGYMHEITNLEKGIKEQFKDIKKSHKKLLMLY